MKAKRAVRRKTPALIQGNTFDLVGLKRQELARRSGLNRLAREGREPMATKRVGLCFKDWQIVILEELARAEGFDHVATFLTRDIHKMYPTLKRRPQKESAQVDLLEHARSSTKAVHRASAAARP